MSEQFEGFDVALKALIELLAALADPKGSHKLLDQFAKERKDALDARKKAESLAKQGQEDRAASEKAEHDAQAKLTEAQGVMVRVEEARKEMAGREARLLEMQQDASRAENSAKFHEQKAAADRQTAEKLSADLEAREKAADATMKEATELKAKYEEALKHLAALPSKAK